MLQPNTRIKISPDTIDATNIRNPTQPVDRSHLAPSRFEKQRQKTQCHYVNLYIYIYLVISPFTMHTHSVVVERHGSNCFIEAGCGDFTTMAMGNRMPKPRRDQSTQVEEKKRLPQYNSCIQKKLQNQPKKQTFL